MIEKEKAKKIDEAKDLLIKATKLLSDAMEPEEGEESKVEDWMKNRVELWCRIHNEGGVVTKEKLHEIWANKMGRDARGLGGFFVGKYASLQYTSDGKVVLTKNASEAIEAWLGVPISEYAKRFKK